MSARARSSLAALRSSSCLVSGEPTVGPDRPGGLRFSSASSSSMTSSLLSLLLGVRGADSWSGQGRRDRFRTCCVRSSPFRFTPRFYLGSRCQRSSQLAWVQFRFRPSALDRVSSASSSECALCSVREGRAGAVRTEEPVRQMVFLFDAELSEF